MAKAKENPYEVEQAVLDLNTAELESLDESKLKELRDKLNDAYSEARRERLETQKQFIVAYKNLGEYRVELMKKVKSGKTNPLKAIEHLREFVAGENLTTDKNSKN